MCASMRKRDRCFIYNNNIANSLVFYLFKTYLHITSPCLNIIHKVSLCLLFVTQNGNNTSPIFTIIYITWTGERESEKKRKKNTNNNVLFPCDARCGKVLFSPVLQCMIFFLSPLPLSVAGVNNWKTNHIHFSLFALPGTNF